MFASQHSVLVGLFSTVQKIAKHGVLASQHDVFGQHELLTLTLARSLTRVDHGMFWAMFGPFGLFNGTLALGSSYREG